MCGVATVWAIEREDELAVRAGDTSSGRTDDAWLQVAAGDTGIESTSGS